MVLGDHVVLSMTEPGFFGNNIFDPKIGKTGQA